MDYAEVVDGLDAALAAAVVDDALAGSDAPAVVWNGSIESTVLLWLAVELRDRRGRVDDVTAIFVDHRCHFEETPEFVATVADAWDVPLVVTANDELVDAADAGASVPVDALGDRDRQRLRAAGHEGEALVLDPRTASGRLLLEVGPLHDALAEGGHDVLLADDREAPDDAPGDRVYVEDGGEAVRVSPLTHMTERSVWRTAIDAELPVNPVYGRGHRTVGTALDAEPAGDDPAWEQVLAPRDDTGGRSGEGDVGGAGEDSGDRAGTATGDRTDEEGSEEERSLMDRLREAGS